MTVSILVIFLLIFLNAVFAMGELALISVRTPRLAILREQGLRGADRAMRLAEDPQIFLPTVQIGMTLVSILEGTFGGVQVEAHLTPLLEKIDVIRPIAGQVSMVLVVLIITALMLVLGELVPKQLALREPEIMAARLALPLEMLAYATLGAQLVRAFRGSGLRWLNRVCGSLMIGLAGTLALYRRSGA